MLFLAYSVAFFDNGEMDIEVLSTNLVISKYHTILLYFAECLSQIGLSEKWHRLCSFNRTLFLRILETENLRPECLPGLVLVSALFLACRSIYSHCVLTWEGDREWVL